MKHVVSFSTGLSSALTAERIFRRYGIENTFVVFMDTTIEDEDNYRFQEEIYKRWRNVYGVENFVTLKDGREPLEVAEDRMIIPNHRAAPCTFELKINLFMGWLEQFKSQDRRYPQATIHIGYDYQEVHRCRATTRNYNRLGFAVDYPLLWKPLELRPYEEVSRQEWGIEPPRMYRLGYSHANCGGRCVKQGQGDWIRTLTHFPERYALVEEWEQKMRRHPRRRRYAIQQDRSNGIRTPLTLKMLRERHEAGNADQLPLLDMESGCVRCGVGDFVEDK